MSHIAYIGIGSNMQNPLEQCRTAMSLITAHPDIALEARSSFYKTEPVGVTEQDWFINAVISAKTTLDPSDLLNALLDIEKQMGRLRQKKWGPRSIDLDLLFYDNSIVESPDLKVPHPEIQNRRFILAPMDEIAGGYIHPVLKKSIGQLLAELPAIPTVSRLQVSA